MKIILGHKAIYYCSNEIEIYYTCLICKSFIREIVKSKELYILNNVYNYTWHLAISCNKIIIKNIIE